MNKLEMIKTFDRETMAYYLAINFMNGVATGMKARNGKQVETVVLPKDALESYFESKEGKTVIQNFYDALGEDDPDD